MAQLPSRDDMQRRLPRASTRGVSIRAPSFDGLAQAGKAIAGGISAMAEADGEIDDYETKKRFLDFRLQTEMALYERNMQPGGANYAAEWQKEFKRSARDFVGKDDTNIPESQRAKVGFMMKQHEVMLQERAMRAEEAERDRYEIEGLAESLEARKTAVASDPDQVARYKAEALELIDNNPRLSPAAKAKLKKDAIPGIIEESYRGRAARAATPEAYKAILDELKPDMPDKMSSRPLEEGRVTKGPSGWAAHNATWKGLSATEKAAAMALLEADGANPDDARNALAAMINRAGRTGEDLGAHVSRSIYQPTIEPAQERRLERILRSPAFADLKGWAERRVAGQEADPVNGATHFLASEQTMLALEAKEPRKYRSWRKWTGFDGQQYRGVVMRDGSHAFLAPDGVAETGVTDDPNAYDGPHAEMTQKQRRRIYNVIVDDQNKKLAGMREEVKTTLASEIEAVRRTGKGSANYDKALDTARMLLNENQLRDHEIERAEAEYEYQLLGGIERLTPDAIADKLQRVKPDANEMSYKAHAKAFDKALRFTEQLQELREKDPAAAVDPGIRTAPDQPAIPVRVGDRIIEVDPDIDGVRGAKKGPLALMDARMAAQAKIGVAPDMRSPITRNEAERLLAPVAGLKGDDLAGPFTKLAVQIEQQYQHHAPAVLRYLARVLYTDRVSREIVGDELTKVLKKPGMAVIDARKLKELEDINAHENARRKGWQNEATTGPAARPSQRHILHLIENPHQAEFFDQKFGKGSAKQILEAAGATAR